mgnify:CR=1 FL=1
MTDLPKAKTRPASNWSAIWVLPLIALVIGGWLGWRAYNETGIQVQVRFESGEGIQANKTEVVYKGMSVGKVKNLTLDDQGKSRGVIATIEMNKDVEQYLKTSTRFWLVKPSVTLAGITGLETLVSGNYVAISPGEGEPTRKFKALEEVAVIFVDFHAETTSEKISLGWALDGTVSAVVGTHTHVQTADERILPGGTAFLCDAGMCGPLDSVLGRETGPVVDRFLTSTPQRFPVAKGPVRLCGVVVDVDPASGRCLGIERFQKLIDDPHENTPDRIGNP